MEAEFVIDLQDLTKNYGEKRAVDHLTLQIKRGEVFGLLGPNGAGKSTTILMMLGLTEPSGGSVHVCGFNATRSPIDVKKRVGYLPDQVGFYEDRSGLSNLVYTAMLNGFSEDEALEKADVLLDQVGLSDAKEKRVGQYSRGMKQRLGLADVLIKSPDLIILDEPTLGIDPKGVQELLILIKQLSQEHGMTVLLSSHHLHQVQQICDRVGLFVGGKLLAVGEVEQLAQKLFTDEAVTTFVKTDQVDDQLLEQLTKLDGVKGVTTDNNGYVVVKSMKEVGSNIAKVLIDQNRKLIEVRPKSYGLDDIYHTFFERGKAGEHTSKSTKITIPSYGAKRNGRPN